MKIITFSYILVLVFVSFFTFASCGGNVAKVGYDRQEKLISKGWHLVKRWDFYNDVEGWNHTTITKRDSGGVVVVEDGALGFGYAKDGGFLFYQSRITPLPNFTYMLVAKAKTNKPYRTLMGFYDKSTQSVLGANRLRNTNWRIMSAVVSFSPTSGERVPVVLYPTFHNLTNTDYAYVDWAELWVFPDKALLK